MDRFLRGRLILIAEDEPLIAMDIALGFEDEGATVIMARTVEQARLAVEAPELSAAILDHALSDGDSAEICERMTERKIPFVTYSGYDPIGRASRGGVHVTKPASISVLVTTVKGLILPRPISN